MHCNVHFELTKERVDRLSAAGVQSLAGLARVLAALDLRAMVELVEVGRSGLTPEPKEEETT